MRVLVSGGTGFIGSALVKTLSKSSKHQVTIISRRSGEGKGIPQITYKEINEKGLPPCDALVQLTGVPFFSQSLSSAFKYHLHGSRIEVTNFLTKAMKNSKDRPKVFVCASAIGYYPISPRGQTFDDDYSGEPANNFAGEICSKWEKAVNGAPEDVRKVMVRFGMVLGKGGGALAQMLIPFRLGLGGRIGSGKQFWPWIHIDDVTNVIQLCLENEKISGPINVVAPECPTNAEFTAALGKAIRRPTFFPMPEFVVKLLFGEIYYMLTEGNRVVPKKLQQLNYQFQYPTLQQALNDIVN